MQGFHETQGRIKRMVWTFGFAKIMNTVEFLKWQKRSSVGCYRPVLIIYTKKSERFCRKIQDIIDQAISITHLITRGDS